MHYRDLLLQKFAQVFHEKSFFCKYYADEIHHALLVGTQTVPDCLKNSVTTFSDIKYANTQDTKITFLAIHDGNYGSI